MLTLLSPWHNILDIKEPEQTFEVAFDQFTSKASRHLKKIMANIQYYYESLDATLKNWGTKAGQGSGQILDIQIKEISSIGEIDEVIINNLTLTEEDVNTARDACYPVRELLHREAAIDIATDFGIFQERYTSITKAALPWAATFDDLRMYQKWATTIQAITKNQPLGQLVDHQIKIGPSVNSVIPNEVEPSLQNISRAHKIVKNHLLSLLNGRIQPQLLMVIIGQGGTGKSTLINAITETSKGNDAAKLLAKTATTGIAASLINGVTIHCVTSMLNPMHIHAIRHIPGSSEPSETSDPASCIRFHFFL